MYFGEEMQGVETVLLTPRGHTYSLLIQLRAAALPCSMLSLTNTAMPPLCSVSELMRKAIASMLKQIDGFDVGLFSFEACRQVVFRNSVGLQ